MKSGLRLIVALGVAGVFLWIFFRGVDFAAVWRAIQEARGDWLAAALVLTIAHYFVRAWRWQLLLKPIRRRVSMGALVDAIVAGYAVTFVTPGRLGEVFRPAYLAKREKLPLGSTLTTVGLDRILDAGALAALLTIFLLVAPTSGPGSLPLEQAETLHQVGWTIGVVMVVLFPALWLAARFRFHLSSVSEAGAGWRQKLRSQLRSLLDGLAVLHGPRELAAAVAGSLLIWVTLAAQAWCGIRAFGIELPFSAGFALVCFLALGIAVPAPAGAGGYHYAGKFALVEVFGAPPDAAVAAVLVLHLISVVPAILWGGWILARGGTSLAEILSGSESRSRPANTEAKAEEESTVDPGATTSRVVEG